MNLKNKIKSKVKLVIGSITLSLLLCISFVILDLTKWFELKFGKISIRAILFTLNSPLDGANIDFVRDAFVFCIPGVIVSILFLFFVIALDNLFHVMKICIDLSGKKNKFNLNIDLGRFYKTFNLFFCFCMLFIAFIKTLKCLGLANANHIKHIKNQTHIYENYYVDPDKIIIKPKGKTKNLICIYLESLETTYASKIVGGAQDKNNYVPNLTNMANKNISFSNNNLLGGFRSVEGTSWTMGSLFATTTGLPFAFPVGGNEMNSFKSFASKTISLGDILLKNGYRQEFLCGSDGNFAGRKKYFEQHGKYEIFDLYTARKKNYIPDNYHVWWGFEDYILYEIARDELKRLSENKDTPFNLTLLTVDTHQVGGYFCKMCKNNYSEPLANIITCADKLVYDFISWCQRQDFYDDTVIVILGDHPRMDKILVDKINYFDRTVYNCFINTFEYDKDNISNRLKHREFTAMDIFPTILSAIGFEIEGERLGLGTNLFSKNKTLLEKMGLEKLNGECAKYSDYYIKRFS